jgi:hypothetical protein
VRSLIFCRFDDKPWNTILLSLEGERDEFLISRLTVQISAMEHRRAHALLNYEQHHYSVYTASFEPSGVQIIREAGNLLKFLSKSRIPIEGENLFVEKALPVNEM